MKIENSKMTYRTALKNSKDLYLVQFKLDNGLCIINDDKLEKKRNLEVGTIKRVKYGSSYLDAVIIGIGKYIVHIHY